MVPAIERGKTKATQINNGCLELALIEWVRSIIAVPANTINVIKMFLILNWILALGLMIPHFVFGELSRSSEKWTASHGLAISVIIITCIVLILNSFGIYM